MKNVLMCKENEIYNNIKENYFITLNNLKTYKIILMTKIYFKSHI